MAIGFASVIWRETWKYGERAFRYCQHDVGHAIGSVRVASQTLGWRMLLLDGLADDTLAALLGIDRDKDFEGAEREHPGCDGTTSISAGSFFTMLSRVMPGARLDLCRRAVPWDVLPWEPAVHLALFVHRVDGLVPGLYLLARDPAKVDSLRDATHPHFDWTIAARCPGDLPLFLLQEGDARALAAQLSCGQGLAGESAFSLGMIAEFEPRLRQHGPWFYRRLFWEAGLIGQMLYLEAEAAGVRATGIGCFFDDPVHQVMGFNDASFQSLYHFTTGGPVEDPRLTTLPPYESCARRSQTNSPPAEQTGGGLFGHPAAA